MQLKESANGGKKLLVEMDQQLHGLPIRIRGCDAEMRKEQVPEWRTFRNRFL